VTVGAHDPVETDPDAAAASKLPALSGRHARLRQIVPADYGWLRRAELDGDLIHRWRHGSGTPSPEEWVRKLWVGVLAQFVVERPEDGEPVGLVMAYQANLQDGHARFAATRLDGSVRSPRLLFGLALFLDYLFACWPLHKLYMETPAYNFEQFASGAGTAFTIEGRLRDHVYLGGRHWDHYILAVYRDAWREYGSRWRDTGRGQTPGAS
jgi:hypothetical protein